MKRTKRTVCFRRGISVIMAFICMLMMSANVFAASDEVRVPALSQELVDSYPVRALKYLGYDVDGLLQDGLLYQDAYLGNNCPSKYRSTIFYSGESYGTAMIKDDTTVTGYAPWLGDMQERGMDCTAFVAFYYFNYLRNIEGLPVDEMWNECFMEFPEGHPNYYRLSAPRCVYGWLKHSEIAVAKGYGYKVGASYADLDYATNGDLIIYENKAENQYRHVAIYIGQYNGKHFAAHISARGPEISVIKEDTMLSSICGIYSFDCTKPQQNDIPVALEGIGPALAERNVAQETPSTDELKTEQPDVLVMKKTMAYMAAGEWFKWAIADYLNGLPKMSQLA